MTRVQWSDGGDGGFVLPAGTVTLLLSDIEASVRAWESDPSAMTAAVVRLEEIVAETVARHGGVRPLEQGEGDSFVAAFARATDAVSAAIALQLATIDEPWPTASPLRLRMAIHSGEVQLRDERNYIGGAVNRCARIRALAHGGQVVISATTRDLVVDSLPAGAELVDLGEHRLRDLARPEHVHQLAHDRMRRSFPPLRSLDALPNNLPIQLTSFIGREADIATVTALIRTRRLVTLAGPGGAGKTRLALQVAAEIVDDGPGGVWFADLTTVTAATALHALAAALGLSANAVTLDGVVTRLQGQRVVVVLDNCEHVLPETASIVDHLLRSCPALAVLATSREPLGVPGEVIWRVPSLRIPDLSAPVAVETLATFDAVRLFIERAQAARPNFSVANDNAPAVAAICARLEGIPLAIELAAARTRVLTADQIARGLDDHYRILGIGPRTSAPRQQTLEASIDWSHSLLDPHEQVALRRLSVFRGGFDLDAAEHVAGLEPIDALDVLDLLSQLVDKSLVNAVDAAGASRYRLLETIRQYAWDQLAASGERETVEARFVNHFATYIGALDAALFDPDAIDSGTRIYREIDNTRAAVAIASRDGDAEALTALVAWAPALALVSGDGVELAPWIERARELSSPASPWWLAILHASAFASIACGDVAAAIPRLHEALEASRAQSNDARTAEILFALGQMTSFALGLDAGRPLFDEAMELARDASPIAVELLSLYSVVLSTFGEAVEATRVHDRVDALRAAGRGLQWHVTDAHRAFTLSLQGEATQALALGQPAVDEIKTNHLDSSLVGALRGTTEALLLLGELDAAEDAALECELVASRINGTIELAQAALLRGRVLAHRGSEHAVAVLRDALVSSAMLGPTAAHLRIALAEAALVTGDSALARATIADAAGTVGADGPYARARLTLISAQCSLLDDDLDRAETAAHDALAVAADQDLTAVTIDCLELIATVAAQLESGIEAARLWGAATAARERSGYRACVLPAPIEHARIAARAALGDDAFDASWDGGAVLSLPSAVALARRGRGERRRPSHGWASITPTEHNVIALVTEGLTNPKIAERLFIGRETVKAHLSSIFTKLDIASRAELAAEAARRNLTTPAD